MTGQSPWARGSAVSWSGKDREVWPGREEGTEVQTRHRVSPGRRELGAAGA